MEGNALNENKASSELAMHILIYKMRPDIHAVCHAHPPHGTAFSVAGLAIEQPILSEVILTLGCVPLTDYGTPSTSELTESMIPFVEHHNALLMANHGAVAYGKDLWEAWDRMETLEHTAKIAILSRALGNTNNLPSDSIEKLINIREKAGYLDTKARCQSCGYLADTNITCELDEHQSNGNSNGAKISFTREELIELLNQVVQMR
jgi:L-fuculose-phosphate aldolase